MVANKDPPSFDDIIQKDRQRRKNEALAKEIFGKSRKTNGNTRNGIRKPGAGPSLASRVGITKASKRSTSSTPRPVTSAPNPKVNVETEWVHDLHQPNNPFASRPSRTHDASGAREVRNERLYEAAAASTASNGGYDEINGHGTGGGISIRGLAGPYIVMGSNFAPGTTAADIESAMLPIAGEIQSCRILTSTPTVIAEMVFMDKGGADNVIVTFNNKKADGRILHIYMKQGNRAPVTAPFQKIPTEPRASRPDLMSTQPSYDRQREQSDRNRRLAEPEIQDGSYGFEAKEDKMDVETEPKRDVWVDDRKDVMRGRDSGRSRDDRMLYSDEMYSRPRGRGFR